MFGESFGKDVPVDGTVGMSWTCSILLTCWCVTQLPRKACLASNWRSHTRGLGVSPLSSAGVKPPNWRQLRQQSSSQIRGRDVGTEITHIQWGPGAAVSTLQWWNTNRLDPKPWGSITCNAGPQGASARLTVDTWSHSFDWDKCNPRGCSEKKHSLCWTHSCYFLKSYFIIACLVSVNVCPDLMSWVIKVAKARVWLMCVTVFHRCDCTRV